MAKNYAFLPHNLPPRGLCRVAAAGYIGVSPSKFDEMVARGEMPQAKCIDRRKVWDRIAIDVAFEALPAPGGSNNNPWDAR